MKYLRFILIFISISLLSVTVHAYKALEFVSEFGGKGEAPGKFSEKIRFAFDKNNIYVLEEDYPRVQKLNLEGNPIMEIVPGDKFIFIRPMDIAVDDKSNIYVVDWTMIHVKGTESPKIFNYGPCVHKFSVKGEFIASFTLDDLSQKPVETERAMPAIDTDGNFALFIRPQNPERQLYISVDAEGNIYVIDQNKIYKLNPSGEPLIVFGESEQFDKPTGMTIDSKGNIYVADSGNHRIVKYSSDGKYLLSFGKEGDRDGLFTGTLSIVLSTLVPPSDGRTEDGTIIVADSARYEKILRTQLDQRKLVDSTILVTGQDDPILQRKREFLNIMRRFQIFDENGKFLEKFLYKIDKTDPELRDLEFKAIDPNGNLYLVDKDRLVIRKYSVQKTFNWSSIDKVFTYRILHNEGRKQIDNPYDLDPYFDFDERQKYFQMTGIMRFDYDMTETFHVALTGYLTQLNGKLTDKYPGDYSNTRGYVQDDISTDKYIAGRLRLDLSLILDHDPFEYRVGDLFAYVGRGRYSFNIDATDINNERRLIEKLWWTVWAVGARYDMGNSMRLSFIASQHKPMDSMNLDYTYWDEEGKLYSTGLFNDTVTQVFIAIDGVF